MQGLLIGLVIAIPVGPIGLLCLRRTLVHGRVVGFVTGFGAATADAIYGAVAGFGVTAISGWLLAEQRLLAVVGGIFLCCLAIRTFRAPARSCGCEPEPAKGRLWSAFVSTFLLTLLNPMTILSFVAVFGALGVGVTASYVGASVLVAGVFSGSVLWWLLLSSVAAMVRDWIGEPLFRWINRFSATLLLSFGGYALWHGIAG